jgi:glutamyl-tRNA synthetase
LLGWSPGDDLSLMDIGEMVRRFDLDHVSKSAAIYAIEKMAWMNAHYLAELSSEEVFSMVESDARGRGWLTVDNHDHIIKIIDLLRSRVRVIQDLLPMRNTSFLLRSIMMKRRGKYFRQPAALKLAAVKSLMYIQPFTADK